MKKALMILSSLLVAVGAFAQGQVNFAARVVPTYDAPVFVGTVAGGVKAEGPAYMAQLYAGASANSLAAVGAALPFRTGAAAGYWVSEARTIPGVDASGKPLPAFIQIRAWSTAAGATYEAAQASGSGFGSSGTLTITPTVAPDVPATLTGLTSFAIAGGAVIPEPSIMALGALGGLVLLLRRRK